MLYFLYGEDIDKRNIKKEKILSGIKPFYLDEKSFNQQILEHYCNSTTIFGDKTTVLVDGVCDTEEGKDILIKNLKLMSDSSNIFVFLEKKPKKDLIKKIEKASAEILEFPKEEKITRKESPIVFSITDAFCSRNKKLAWMYFLEAEEKNTSPEEICGTLFWAIKNMLIAKESNNISSSGLSPFVFNKSKRNSGNFTKEELKKLSFEIINIYHKAHSGKVDFMSSLEEFILKNI